MGSFPFQASSVLVTGEGETRTFASSLLKFLTIFSALQMESASDDWLGSPGCNGVITEDMVLLTLWAGFHHGSEDLEPTSQSSVMPKPCLTCCVLGAPAFGALFGARLLRVQLAEGVASLEEGRFPKRCQQRKDSLEKSVALPKSS